MVRGAARNFRLTPSNLVDYSHRRKRRGFEQQETKQVNLCKGTASIPSYCEVSAMTMRWSSCLPKAVYLGSRKAIRQSQIVCTLEYFSVRLVPLVQFAVSHIWKSRTFRDDQSPPNRLYTNLIAKRIPKLTKSIPSPRRHKLDSIWRIAEEQLHAAVPVDLEAEVVSVEEVVTEVVDVVDHVVVPTRTRRRNGSQSPSSVVSSRPERSSQWRRSTFTLCQSRSTRLLTSSSQSSRMRL